MMVSRLAKCLVSVAVFFAPILSSFASGYTYYDESEDGNSDVYEENRPIPHDFEEDGIFYRYTSDHSVEVSYYLNKAIADQWGNQNATIQDLGGGSYSGEVIIPSVTRSGYTVTSIGEWTFYNCFDLESVVIPESVRTIGKYAFTCCEVQSVLIPEGVTTIGYRAFATCPSLTSITIPSSVTHIGEEAFECCSSIQSIVVTEGNTVYDSRENCNAIIETATNTLVVGCHTTQIPNDVIRIGGYAFCDNSNITDISIPNSVTSIGEYAFGYCVNLSSITVNSELPPSLDNDAFEGINSDCTLYVPAGSLVAYQNAKGWKEFGSIVEMMLETDINEYDNALYASAAEARTSTTVTIPINMKNSVMVRDYSFYLVLPEAIDPSSVTLKKSTARKEDELSFRTAVQADGSIKVVCYSTDGQPFSGNDGEVATLTFTVPADMEVGDYPIIIKNAELSENGTPHKIPEEIISCLHIENYLPGDANMDGEVSVSDLTCIVSYLLNLEVPETFYAKAADANEDGEVSVSDLTIIVNIILYGNPNGANGAKARGERSAADCLFSAAPFTIVPGEEATLSLLLSSDQEVTAFQFDAVLPDGLTCTDAKRSALVSEDHSFRSASLEDNLTRIVCYSGSNATFAANEGTIAELIIKADKHLLPGLYALNLNNAEAVSISGTTKLAPLTITFEVTAPTGIEILDKEHEDLPRYDLMGRRINQTNGILYLENGKKILVK